MNIIKFITTEKNTGKEAQKSINARNLWIYNIQYYSSITSLINVNQCIFIGKFGFLAIFSKKCTFFFSIKNGYI